MMSLKSVLILAVFCLWEGECCYQSGWSHWINDYKPSTKLFPSEKHEGIQAGGGDIENMNQTERDRFCPPGHGTISDIECATPDGRRYNTTGQPHMECSVVKGFKCSNRLAGGHCLDYTIRLYCRCNNPVSPTSTKLSTVAKDSSAHNGHVATSTQQPADQTTRSSRATTSGVGRASSTVAGQGPSLASVIKSTGDIGKIKVNSHASPSSSDVPPTSPNMTTGRSLIHNGHNVGGAKTGQTVKVGKGTGHMGTNTIPGGRPTTASAAGHKTQDQGKTSKRAGNAGTTVRPTMVAAIVVLALALHRFIVEAIVLTN